MGLLQVLCPPISLSIKRNNNDAVLLGQFYHSLGIIPHVLKQLSMQEVSRYAHIARTIPRFLLVRDSEIRHTHRFYQTILVLTLITLQNVLSSGIW